MASSVQPASSHPTSSTDIMMMMASNFQSEGAIATIDVDTNLNDGPRRSNSSGSNFDNHHAASAAAVATDESHASSGSGSGCGCGDAASHHDHDADADDEDIDADSHFSDIAQAAAKAMEHIDMDKLCSELFSQEMLSQEMLEEAVASATGVSAADLATAVGVAGGVGAQSSAAQSASAAAPSSEGPQALGVVTPSHIAQGASGTSKSATSTKNSTPTTGGNKVVTDCASSLDGSESTIPSTIAVPSKNASVLASVGETLKPRPSSAYYANKSSAGTMASNFPINDASTVQQTRVQGQVAAMNVTTKLGPSPQQPTMTNQAPLTGHVHAMAPSMTNVSAAMAPQVNNTNCQHVVEEDALCVRCQYPGAEVHIRCPSGCAYHARCMDLMTICRDAKSSNNTGEASEAPTKATKHQDVTVQTCPHCRAPSSGMEILPLSFAEMDRVQQSARAAFLNCGLGRSLSSSSSNGALGSTKRSHDSMMYGQVLPTTIPSHAGAQPRRTVQCYDPSQPRTGRWTDEEILFRDTLISHFLAGALPLGNGLKLNDFLPIMLKSKQSRLAKKMKHAKLSTKYFYPKMGCVGTLDAAKELSRLEREFVASIPDPVERSEVKFHMGREWREHFANRCASLSIIFDGRAWLSSVEDMERRLAFEKERHRLVKRRFMMGKAMEKDVSKLERGVFVNESVGKEEFELVVEKSVSNSAGRNRDINNNGASLSVPYNSPPPVVLGGRIGAGDAPPSVWTSNEPNFKHAAPFLAGIASYIERNGVPFEHVDVWVPSFVEEPGVSGSTPPSSPGGVGVECPEKSSFRLCFGGSVTMGVQIAHDPTNNESGNCDNPAAATRRSPSPPSSIATMKRHPLTSEDKTNFALFGDYSQKFSFSSGCGLPGRIFKSGVPAWEQFVSRAHPSMFERRGGAVQFGVKTAVGLPIDSPNVGRVVLVMYSKYDRPKDEHLVGRMLVDLKLLNPCPRWKLVVDVDTPVGMGGGNSSMSSLQAPPPEVTARGSPVFSATTFSRANSNSSAYSTTNPATASVGNANPVDPAASNKEKQIKALLLLLASNIPSDMNSPLGQQLQGIMSLRLILLRGNKRTPEEEQLVDTLLVLYESYIHAGRSQKDIAVMVARDFTFHLGHLGGLAARYGCPAPAPQGSPPVGAPAPQMYRAPAPANNMTCPAPAPQGQMNNQMYRAPAPANNQMYRAPAPTNNMQAMGRAPVPPPMAGMGVNPLMGPLGAYNHLRPTPPQVQNPRSPPMPAGMMTNHLNMSYQPQQQQYARSQSMTSVPSQNSVAGSPRSTASR